MLSSPRHLSNITNKAGRRPLLERDLFCSEKTSADLGRPLSYCPLGSAPLASQLPEISPSPGGAAGLQAFELPQTSRALAGTEQGDGGSETELEVTIAKVGAAPWRPRRSPVRTGERQGCGAFRGVRVSRP